ncbi:hypothetical protein C491_04455 [Natronococcus amylolyticus DSM 10524]|uniref:Uncharacterized protein n=1 Tax=Natronococcus amylolyticus DSM 10524 TaxID=1227497 RepID=L9XFM8_9EURY|nr:hypothetical protein [Natronococcus amylolyticus]ELY60519.1 hypothetical protein C491_04455 [Natronococcus amylolyticus DSM 10524]
MSPPSNRDQNTEGDAIDDRLVEAIRAAPKPVVNTTYLAGKFDVTPRELVPRLESLVEAGRLEGHQVAGEGYLWWLSLEEELGE